MKSLFYNLSGGLNTAATKTDLGLETSKVFWSEAQNVEIFKNKGVTRQNGNTQTFCASLNKPITSIFGYVIDGIEYILHTTDDGQLYCYNSDSEVITEVAYKFTSPLNITYTRFLQGVVLSNGVDEPIYYNHKNPSAVESTKATASTAAKIRSTAVCAYKGRLWMAMGGTLYFSALGRYNDWSSANDAGYISNFLCDVDEITALAGYKDYLAIYKADATFMLSGSNPTDFAVQKFADKGARNQSMVINVANKQYFFNSAVFTLEQVGILSQLTLGQELSLDIKPEFELYNNSSPYRGCAIHYEAKNQLWFFCPTISNVYISTVLIYDYINQAWTKRIIPQQITSATSCNGKIYTATADGIVLQEDSGHTFNGEPIEFVWKSPFFSLGEPNLRKCVEDFYFLLDDNFDNQFRFSTYKNYDSACEDDIIAIDTQNSDFLVWDSDLYNWADDNLGNIWTNLGEGVYKSEITQSNYSVQLAIHGDKPTHNFALIGLEFKEVYYD